MAWQQQHQKERGAEEMLDLEAAFSVLLGFDMSYSTSLNYSEILITWLFLKNLVSASQNPVPVKNLQFSRFGLLKVCICKGLQFLVLSN